MDNKDWYWKNGLHDAEIKKIQHVDVEYDFSLKNPIRNILIIDLDSRNALFDTSVKSLEFYNYKLIQDIDDIIGFWWIKDEVLGCP